jgi:deoxyribodipyrimidine photo-lyase
VPIPHDRLTPLNAAAPRPERAFVLYWCVMARRTTYSFALQHAVETARALGRPLVVLEALRAGYPWANARLHRFALDGMADDAAAYARAGVAHLAYVEPEPGAGRGLLETLAGRACVVVTDEFPEFFLPRMLAAAGRKLAAMGTRLEMVDGNGLLPLRAAGRAWPSAPHFRPHAAARAAHAARLVPRGGAARRGARAAARRGRARRVAGRRAGALADGLAGAARPRRSGRDPRAGRAAH